MSNDSSWATNRTLGWDMPRVKLKIIWIARFWTDSRCWACVRLMRWCQAGTFRQKGRRSDVDNFWSRRFAAVQQVTDAVKTSGLRREDILGPLRPFYYDNIRVTRFGRSCFCSSASTTSRAIHRGRLVWKPSPQLSPAHQSDATGLPYCCVEITSDFK